MRIIDADRHLAREIAELFDCTDPRTEKALAIALAAHRQSVDATPAQQCPSILHGMNGMPSYRCQQVGPHSVHLNNLTSWTTEAGWMTPPLCNAISAQTGRTCVLGAGHPRTQSGLDSHQTADGRWF